VNRRQLLGGAVAAPLLLHAHTAFAAASADADVIAAAVGIEDVAIFAYDAALKSNLLDASTTKLAQLLRSQEQQHRDALNVALRRLGGTAPPPPTSPAANQLLAPLTQAKSQQDLLAFAIQVETATVAAYYDAQGQLGAPSLLRATAEIMANEGQHLVLLRQALGQPAVPNAFETGKPSP
jgi:rubrerythrin